MQGRNAFVVVWTAAGTLCASSAGAQTIRYHAEPISVPDGFMPRAINASRAMIGGGFDDQGVRRPGVLADGVVRFVDAGGGVSTEIFDINDDGLVVGSFYSEDQGSERGFTWRDGVLRPLRLFDGPAPLSRALATSAQGGRIVGFAGLGSSVAAAAWDHAGAAPTLLGGNSSDSFAVNDRGDVVGVQDIGDGEDVITVWQHDGTSRRLAAPPDVFPSFNMRINNAGEVVATTDFDPRLLFWNAKGELTVIASGWNSIDLIGIDDEGRVLWTGVESIASTPMMWQHGVSTSLYDLVDGFDGQIGGVSRMNSRGEFVAGTSEGNWQLFTPVPTPGVCVGVALFAGMTTSRRRARSS